MQALVAESAPGDVVGVMCHAEREAIEEWLAAEGATIDGPDEIRAKVLATRRPHPPRDRQEPDSTAPLRRPVADEGALAVGVGLTSQSSQGP